MSSKFNVSTFAKENAFNTKDDASKKATKDVAKVYSQKALKRRSTVCDYNNHPSKCARLSKFDAVEQTKLSAKHFQKHGYVYSGGDRKDEKKKEADASFTVAQSSSNVFNSELYFYQQTLLPKLKERADFTEEVARYAEKTTELVTKCALEADAAAEMLRKTTEDESDASFSSPEFLRGLKRRRDDRFEEAARNRLKALEYAAENVSITKAMAEMFRKRVDDMEKLLYEAGMASKVPIIE